MSELAQVSDVAEERTVANDPGAADLRRHSIRGGAVTMMAQGCRFALTFASMAILARLLTPTDFGLLAMAFAITSFGEVLAQLGLSTATIQKRNISHEQVNSLFWLNMLLGVSACLLVELAAPLIGRFYGDPRLVGISRMLGLMFVLGALATQHRALLSREMRFMALSGIDIAAQFVGIVTGIIMAWLGMGYWALVMMYLARDTTTTVGAWWRSRWRPGWPAGCRELKSLVAFGANITGGQVIGTLARQCDSVLLGWWAGPFVLGIYSKAWQLALLINQQVDIPLTRVMIPALSRLQADASRYRDYFRKSAMLLAALEMPMVAFVFVCAPLVVEVVLGSQWAAAAWIFRILAPAMFFWPVSTAMDWALVSTGRVNREFRWELVSSGALVAGFFASVIWGAVGMAIAFSIMYCTVRIGYPSLRYCLRGTPVTVRELAGGIWRPAAASIIAAGLLALTMRFGPGGLHPVAQLLLGSIAYGTLYLLAWLVLPHGRRTVLDLVHALRIEFLPARFQSDRRDTTARTIHVVLRYDDYSAVSRTDVECRIIESLRRHGLCCTFAAVPATVAGSQKDRSRQKHIPLSERKAAILRDAARDDTIEVALHGFSHQTRRRRFWADYSEFHGGSGSEQQAKVEIGKRSLQALLGFPVATFVPPWNTYDRTTLRVLEDAGFRAISADLGGPLATNLGSVPATCTLDQLRQAVDLARASDDRAPVIGVLFHEFDFREVDGKGNWTIERFDQLLAWLSAQADVQVRTVGQQVQDAASEPARLRLLHAAHIASRLAPRTAAGPRVCWSSGWACWKSLLSMWMCNAVFYGALLGLSIEFACMARMWLRGTGVVSASAGGMATVMLALAWTAKSLRNADRRIKLSAAANVLMGLCAGMILAGWHTGGDLSW